MNNLREYIDYLKSIDFGDKSLPSEDYKKLFREFLRRSALWAKKFDHEIGWPFWNIAKTIDPNIQVDDSFISELRAYLSETDITVYFLAVLERSLYWVALKSKRSLDCFDLPDPYEPIIQFYTSGGWFWVEHSGLISIYGSDGYVTLVKHKEKERFFPE